MTDSRERAFPVHPEYRDPARVAADVLTCTAPSCREDAVDHGYCDLHAVTARRWRLIP